MANWLTRVRCVFWLFLVLAPGVAQAATDDIAISVSVTPASTNQSESTNRLERANEHILSFDARARFNTDGSMLMNENIKVLSLGQQIRRGIFRTLPLTWNRQDGKIFSVDYQIQNVLRDGVAEPFSVVKEGKTLTVRIGSAEHLLQPGVYSYEIQYRISNHFSRFPDWDELYWNVTGNDWAYSIDKASFHLELPESSAFLNPEGKDTRLQSIDIYTGRPGAKEQDARILADGSVQTMQPLQQGKGLTVVYTWPRSILADAPAPEAALPLIHLLLPTVKTSSLWIPVFLLLGYYLLWWRKNVTATGLKMPPIVPLYALPADMSPGYLRFITQRKYDDIAFSSDLLDLVAKRALDITDKQSTTKRAANEQWLSLRTDENKKPLNVNDKKLLSILFSGDRKNINLSKAYQRPMQNARQELEKRCTAQQKQLFVQRSGPIWRGILIMLLVPLICGTLFNAGVAIVTIPALLLLLVGLTLLSFLLRLLFNPRKILNDWGFFSLFLALIFGPLATFASGLLMFNLFPITQLPAGYVGALLLVMLFCVGFGWIAPRYTQQGLNNLATAQGLKLYLGAAEKHRYQTLYPPDKLASHFERMLPYALALGVGKTWANTFSQYLISTGTMSEVFANADWDSVHHFSQSCGSSSKATPSSSSGSSSGSSSSYSGSGSSGGGSSGGGSGGGGGGGW
ncbi:MULTISPECIES: DUF2207 domain-containing protein [unclassified Serratia (in: enterobacteria)]|uniref:DUF2207 domain-containing protein n=1 Tax=unclassified Serratia (in: enterobacteria) TaxID=2647522 RepID=UPI000501250D|nr:MULTISPECIES: DUF2207 domain-containing protein [unclassified Serratia (in: enterobacteria)]KFK95599.1 membrane protein [Serratia sp. Ag2]KFL00387.1 membrane protein [Serratia sp. Ag1]